MLRQNEAELKISMEIDLQNSSTDKAGKICEGNLVEISFGNYTSASFWQSVATTAPFNN